MTSRSDAAVPFELPSVPVDEAAVRQIVAVVAGCTRGFRRVDLAHALLTMVGTEIAANAADAAAAKRHGQIVAKQLKAFTRAKYAERLGKAVAP